MADKKVSGTITIQVDDINSLKCKTLLTYIAALHYRFNVQSYKNIRRSMKPRLLVGQAKAVPGLFESVGFPAGSE
jgi:hypothetical protein